MATTPVSLKDAVSKAVQEQAPVVEEQPEVKEPVVDEKPEVKEKPAEPAPADNVLEIDASPEEIKRGLELLKTLADPVKVKDFANQLAKQVGIIQDQTKVTPAEAKQTTLDILKAHLGEENEYLAEKLSTALDALLEKKIQQPLAEKELQQQVQEVQKQINVAYADFEKTHADFKEVENKMFEISKQVAPGPDASIESYLNTLYTLAKGTDIKAEVKKETTKVVKKIVENAQETKRNVSSDVDETRVTKGSHRPTAREAVLSALDEMNKGKN